MKFIFENFCYLIKSQNKHKKNVMIIYDAATLNRAQICRQYYYNEPYCRGCRILLCVYKQLIITYDIIHANRIIINI